MIKTGYRTYIMDPYRIISYDARKADGTLPSVIMGKFCSVATNCTFCLCNHLCDRITTAGTPRMLFEHGQGNSHSYSKGDIIIHNDVYIGVNCTILDGVTIGNGAVIGAGSVVTKSVPPYAIVGGNPAQVLKYRFSDEIINKLESLNIWELPDNEIEKIDLWTTPSTMNLSTEPWSSRSVSARASLPCSQAGHV